MPDTDPSTGVRLAVDASLSSARGRYFALGAADLGDSRDSCVCEAESLRGFILAVRARDQSFEPPLSSGFCEMRLAAFSAVLRAHVAVLGSVSGVDYSAKYLPAVSGVAQELRLGLRRILSGEVGFRTFGVSAEESIDSMIFRLNEDRLAPENHRREASSETNQKM